MKFFKTIAALTEIVFFVLVLVSWIIGASIVVELIYNSIT